MKVCSTENMQIAERELIINGTPARTLMKLASAGIAEAVTQFFPVPGLCIAYVGKGNNGGDALTVLNILKQHGWETGFPRRLPARGMGGTARAAARGNISSAPGIPGSAAAPYG